MSYPEIDEPECDECGTYHIKLICEECAEKKFVEPKQEVAKVKE